VQGSISTARSLWPWLAQIRGARFIDLTHAFDESIPHCESFATAQRTTLYHHREGVGTLGHGFLAHEYRHVGQWGTHVDPGAHFVEGKRFLDEIPFAEMVLPLVVLDIETQVDRDPDYCIGMDDVRAWERRHGPYPCRRVRRQAQWAVQALAVAERHDEPRRLGRCAFSWLEPPGAAVRLRGARRHGLWA
jgi:kynurenine formamidase